MAREVQAGTTSAAQRRVYFDVRSSSDGITPATAEAGEQPQISVDGVAWTDDGISTLTHIGNGRYFADLDEATVADPEHVIETRYKGASTVETPGDSVITVAYDPYDFATWANGPIEFTYTVFKPDQVTPLESARVYVTDNAEGTGRSQVRVTDALGRVRFNLYPGTYYFWRSASGYTFSNPDIEVVD